MVIRVLTGRWLGQDGQLGPVGREVLAAARTHEGLVAAHFGRQVKSEGGRIVLVTVWRTPRDVYAWAGPDLTRPRWLDGREHLIQDVTVQHFETVDDEVSEPWT